MMKSSSGHVLLIAHHLDPDHSMESRLSWHRAVEAASRHRVTVICSDATEAVIDRFRRISPKSQVLVVRHTALEDFFIRRGIFYPAYRKWHGRVFQEASEIHRRRPFSLAHQVSYCGYREPGECWRLDAPFVWGPIGGSQNLPWRFLPTLGLIGALRESFRTVVNGLQLRFSRKVKRALGNSAATLAANSQLQADFQRIHGVELGLLLETGIEEVANRARPLRDSQEPLRILWAGRLESWKALPLLLDALAQIKDRVPLELRVVGDGSLARKWRIKANALGIDRQIQWGGWPPNSQRGEHYEWADVFAFTSLRDTSGTGLLESLACGVPIVGLNHQGAKDIMTTESCVPIAVHSPKQVIRDIASAIEGLAADSNKLKLLSENALLRAQEFLWSRNEEQMFATYDSVMAPATRQMIATSSSRVDLAEAAAATAFDPSVL